MAKEWDRVPDAAPRDRMPVSQNERADCAGAPPRLVSAESTGGSRTRDELLLARTRALMRLQTACSPAQRGSLEHTIAGLDAELAES